MSDQNQGTVTFDANDPEEAAMALAMLSSLVDRRERRAMSKLLDTGPGKLAAIEAMLACARMVTRRKSREDVLVSDITDAWLAGNGIARLVKGDE